VWTGRGVPGAPFLALVLAACLLSACSTGPKAAGSAPFSPRPIVVLTTAPSRTGPFVVVAVDNHFHDIHPSDPPTLGEDRPFEVKNEGLNLHNFTVVGTGISVDIPPGGSLRWSRLGDHLKPGFYTVVCTYHTWIGMTGNFAVTR
jgi:hypothetical protein